MVDSISVIGLGKLGAPMAACFASKGYRVVGVELDSCKVNAMNALSAPVLETGLNDMLKFAGDRLTATQDIEAAVTATQVTFIVVATPSEPDGGFSLRYVLPVCERIGHALAVKTGFHLVCLTSTVMPGTTDGPVRSVLEQTSGKRCGVGFGLCYNPEFIALGSVIHDFLNPDFILIGESDRYSGDLLETIYSKVCENSAKAARMSTIDAELAKLSLNTYVTTKISFANMLARICERLSGADVDAVTTALGLDSRIGPKYLRGAVSYGGPCFPRDNSALAALAKKVGAPADIAQATDRFNRNQVKWLADLVEGSFLGRLGNAGILGLTYKPNTDVVEEAAGLLLAQELVNRGVPVVVYDPAGNTNALRVLDHRVRFAGTALECIEQTDVVVLATPWSEFGAISRERWSRGGVARTVIDCWRGLKHLKNCEGVRYMCLGTGPQSTETHVLSAAPPPRATSLVTIFACPKPFHGHAGVIQRNAIKTWMRLRPRPEVILFGDDEGTSEVTQELGLRHLSTVQHSEWGTPLVSDMFEKVQALASHDVLCYVNADILLLDGFVDAIKRVTSWRDHFLMAGRKTDIDLDQAEACKSEEDQERLLAQVSQRKKVVWPGALEYFVFSRGLFADIPPFGIGRTVWDNWLVWKARSSRVPFVDASALIIAAHPIHDYSHHPQGRRGVYQGEEAIWNQSLAGRHLGTIEDATHKLTLRGIERNVGQLLVRRTRSVRHLLGIRRDNVESVMSRFGLLKA